MPCGCHSMNKTRLYVFALKELHNYLLNLSFVYDSCVFPVLILFLTSYLKYLAKFISLQQLGVGVSVEPFLQDKHLKGE